MAATKKNITFNSDDKKIDFSKVKEIIELICQELNNNSYYFIEDLKENELSKSAFKLIKELKNKKDFIEIFDPNQLVFLTNSAYSLNTYDIFKNAILNTMENGIDNTILKLNNLFNNKEVAYSYFTLLGIKINKEYLIKDNIILKPLIGDNKSKNQDNFSVLNFKDSIINDAYNCNAALILTNKITIKKHDLEKKINLESKETSEIYLIAQLISLQTKAGCTVFENYTKYNTDCLMSSPLSIGLGECKFFPDFAVDVEIEVEKLLNLLSNIKDFSTKDFKHLETILTMFSYSCLKRNKIDSCIELRSILEMIYAKSRESSYSSIIPQRGALFLEQNFEERQKIYNELKDLYDFASRVVHGEREYKTGDQEKIEKLKEYCWKSILKIIEKKKFYESKDWNNLIFS